MAFMDSVKVHSVLAEGTTVILEKQLRLPDKISDIFSARAAEG